MDLHAVYLRITAHLNLIPIFTYVLFFTLSGRLEVHNIDDISSIQYVQAALNLESLPPLNTFKNLLKSTLTEQFNCF